MLKVGPNENKDALGTIWNAWQTQWSGVVASNTTSNDIHDGMGGITRQTRTVTTTTPQNVLSNLMQTSLLTPTMSNPLCTSL